MLFGIIITFLVLWLSLTAGAVFVLRKRGMEPQRRRERISSNILIPAILLIAGVYAVLFRIPFLPMNRESRALDKKRRAEIKAEAAMSKEERAVHLHKKDVDGFFREYGWFVKGLQPDSEEWKEATQEDKFPDDVNALFDALINAAVEMAWMQETAESIGADLSVEHATLHSRLDHLKALLVEHFDFDEEEAEDYIIDQVAYSMLEADMKRDPYQGKNNLRNLAEDYFIPVKTS